MKVGSKVECILEDDGYRAVNGRDVLLASVINVSDILTIRSSVEIDGKTYLLFEELKNILHPVLGVECCYAARKFREMNEEVTALIEECKTETV